MTQAELEKLLGRSLTATEIANREIYLDIATEALEDMICTPIADEENATRIFDTRKGYQTAFVDIFRTVTEVKLDGDVIDPSVYEPRQWEKRNGAWFNSIVFDNAISTRGDLEVTADWGFVVGEETNTVPVGLQTVLAGLFAQITKRNQTDGTVASKAVEDFSITFNKDVDLDEAFYQKYGATLKKYSLCGIGTIRQGEVCHDHDSLRHI